MAQLLIVHEVTDYAKWQLVFDEHDSVRRANGGEGYLLFQNASIPIR